MLLALFTLFHVCAGAQSLEDSVKVILQHRWVHAFVLEQRNSASTQRDTVRTALYDIEFDDKLTYVGKSCTQFRLNDPGSEVVCRIRGVLKIRKNPFRAWITLDEDMPSKPDLIGSRYFLETGTLELLPAENSPKGFVLRGELSTKRARGIRTVVFR